ncbi:MAG TPA: HAMP domain-containing sensor histidine kinase [Bdellovibrionota bacterium]|nr:HAMP domain-containing sensor histidine kinase [Bdellovibrionota bacterium]
MKERFRNPALVVLLLLAGLHILFPLALPALSQRFNLGVNGTGMVVAVHEFLCSCFSFLVIRSAWRRGEFPSWATMLGWAFLALAIGDLMYGVTSHILRTPPPRGLEPLLHEVPYVLFSIFSAVAVFLRATEGLARRQWRGVAAFVVLLASLYFTVSFALILNPFFHVTPIRPVAIYTTAVLYAIGQAVFVGSLVVASFRALSIPEFLLWFCFLTLSGSDLVLRYQDMGGSIVGIPFSEYGWQIAVAGIASVLSIEWYRGTLRRSLSTPAPLYSLRVMTAGLSFIALFAFVLVTWTFSSYLGIATPGGAGFHITVFIGIWSASNAISIAVCGILRRVHDQLLAQGDQVVDHLGPMLWEVDGVFRFLNERNRELQRERDTVLRLTSTVAHNLRTPLLSMNTAIGKLERTVEAEPTITKALELLRLAMKNVEAIANEVLLERKKLQFAESIPESVNGAIQILGQTFPSQKFVLERGDAKISSAKLRGLTPVLMNLLKNAAESNTDSKSITVRVNGAGSRCLIEIEDHGSGMADDVLSALKRGESRTTKKDGNGLGVLAAMKWAKENRARFDIDSALGRGTRVRLEIG